MDEAIKKILAADYSEIPGLTEELALDMQKTVHNFSAIVMAVPGTGKTFMLGTLPLPLLIFAFDPNAAVTIKSAYKDLFNKEWVKILPFWKRESFNKPINFDNFEIAFDKMLEERFFDKFASVAIDSFTTFSRSASYSCLYYNNNMREKKAAENKNSKHKNPKDARLQNLAMGDYNSLYASIYHKITGIQGRPVNFVLTGHLAPVIETYTVNFKEMERTIGYELNAFRTLKSTVPALFPEKYCLVREGDGANQEFKLLTAPYAGLYHASSGLAASGNLNYIEKPNFRHLLKKADFDYEDKPHWRTGEVLDKNLLPDWLKEYV
jgi:hypothetical protein